MKKITITYDPAGDGFNLDIEQEPYPHNAQGNPVIPEEDKELPGEDTPIPSIKF